MSSFEIYSVLQWWFVIFIIGFGFLPFTSFIFSRFFDKGYIFSKLLGIAITSYAVYLLGILHIVPFEKLYSILIIIFVSGIFTYLLPIKRQFTQFIKQNWKIFLLEEIIFIVALFAWCYVHAFNPDIHGLEKYMDFGFINSILRSEYFPPKDMWFTPTKEMPGGFINYYFYGHYITAFLTKLSGVPSSLTFNIMLSTLFAFCFTETFSIGANLFFIAKENTKTSKFRSKLFIAGMLTAILATLGGNLHILYSFFEPYPLDDPKPVWELEFKPTSFPNSYWYPNATRYIYHTIHEFPVYSWVVADVHGHVLDIPFVLLFIALSLVFFIKSDPFYKPENDRGSPTGKLAWLDSKIIKAFISYFRVHPLALVLIGFMLAVMFMTNAWDGVIYMLLISIMLLYLYIFKETKNNLPKWKYLILIPVPIIIVALSYVIFSLPYNIFFKPFASGVGVLCGWDTLTKIGKIGPFLFEPDHCQRSFIWELLMLYGFFYFFVASFLIFLRNSKNVLRIDAFALILIITSTILIFLPEIIYVKDIYPGHYRANTMFKLVFQAFIMLSIVSVYVIHRVSFGKLKFIFLISSSALIALVMTYPYLAIPSYYGDLKNYKGLNGTDYLKTLYPSDYEAIQWLNKNVKGQPVILEAQGDSYTDYARISANTGLPTVLGWTVHEWLWRGDYGIPAPRITDVQILYDTNEVKRAKELIDKYNIEYVFVGALEYEKYPNIRLDKFYQLGKIVFEKDNTKIFKISK